MNMKRTLIATSISLALGAGAQVANAGVYGASYLDIDNLNVFITEDGQIPGGASVTSFNFNTTNTAFINDIGGATSASCAGTLAVNDCDDVGPSVLDAAVYNAPGSNPLQGENTFGKFGPGGDQYSHADSVIWNAALVDGTPTETEQLAQSEIQSANSANSNATLSSGTQIVMTFTVQEGGTLILSFEANSWLESDVNLPDGQSGISQADVNVQFQLSNNSGANDGFILWTPQGTFGTPADNDCIAIAAACVELADSGDLNNTTNASGSLNNETANAAGTFGIQVTGLQAGTWTLSLSGVTKTNLSRIPVPGTVMLLGLGLMGMAGSLRKKKAIRS